MIAEESRRNPALPFCGRVHRVITSVPTDGWVNSTNIVAGLGHGEAAIPAMRHRVRASLQYLSREKHSVVKSASGSPVRRTWQRPECGRIEPNGGWRTGAPEWTSRKTPNKGAKRIWPKPVMQRNAPQACAMWRRGGFCFRSPNPGGSWRRRSGIIQFRRGGHLGEIAALGRPYRGWAKPPFRRKAPPLLPRMLASRLSEVV